MQKHCDKNNSILIIDEKRFFDNIIEKNHAFKKLNKIINFSEIITPFRDLYSNTGRIGYDIEKGFKALLIRFWEDYSDREKWKNV
jgi:hypothetical protein